VAAVEERQKAPAAAVGERQKVPAALAESQKAQAVPAGEPQTASAVAVGEPLKVLAAAVGARQKAEAAGAALQASRRVQAPERAVPQAAQQQPGRPVQGLPARHGNISSSGPYAPQAERPPWSRNASHMLDR
jgi:hypothetical protein